MRTNLRLRYGLFWSSHNAPIPWRYIFGLVVIFLLYTLASTMDYYYAKAMEAEKISVMKDSYEKALIQCINGDGRFQWGNELFECRGGSLGKAEI